MTPPDDDRPLDAAPPSPAEDPARARDGSDEEGPESKKDQILALYDSGIGDVEDLALLTQSRPSYVGGVLQEEGLGEGYFDLYTSTRRPMNVYSKYFAGKLHFKDVAAAEESVAVIDRAHRQFELARDRAGQHHALQMALTMYDRARWTGKTEEAEPFRRWLVGQLGVNPRPPDDRDQPAV